MYISIVLLIFSNVLQAKAYDYDYDYDYGYDYDYWDYDHCNDNWWMTCDGDFCTDKTEWIDIETEVPIPNTKLNKLDYDYFAISTVSAIKECTPSLGVKVGTMNNVYSQDNKNIYTGLCRLCKKLQKHNIR